MQREFRKRGHVGLLDTQPRRQRRVPPRARGAVPTLSRQCRVAPCTRGVPRLTANTGFGPWLSGKTPYNLLTCLRLTAASRDFLTRNPADNAPSIPALEVLKNFLG